MTKKSRVEQRDRLMISLGILISPIWRLVESLETLRPTVPYVEAQFRRDFRDFQTELQAFCNDGVHFFEAEFTNARRRVTQLTQFIRNCANISNPIDGLKRDLATHVEEISEMIRVIPCDDLGAILPAESPFKTYLRLRAICAAVSNRLEIFDPYLSSAVFHRYLADVPSSAILTIVTSEKVMLRPREIRLRDQIVAVSELFARERKEKYRFLVTAEQHDRHCRADDEIFHLGGSVKDASMSDPYTLSKLDSTQSNHSFLDTVIGSATVWFGPETSTHRRS